MSTLAKKVSIARGARLKVYYDTREILDTTSVLNFFQTNPDKDVTRNNYISNPFPGEDDRMIIGLSFEVVKQAISLDSGNSIDPELIINGIKDAGVKLAADNDYKEFLRAPLSNHFNFLGTSLSIAHAVTGDPVAAGTTSNQDKVVTMKNSSMHQVPDPFIVAGNQYMDLQVTFEDNSNFPSGTNWDASTQGRLFLRAKLYVAELRNN